MREREREEKHPYREKKKEERDSFCV